MAVLLFWLVMMGMLIQRTYLQPSSVIALDIITEEGIRTGVEWFGIYQQGRKIGYAKTLITMDGDAYHISEESELDLLVLGRVQRVATVINSYTTRNFLLKYFDFSLDSEASNMRIKGAVVGKYLVLDIITAGQTRKERILLNEPPYLSPNIKPALILLGLAPGKRYRFSLFNPATMSSEDAFITVEAQEFMKIGDEQRPVYRLRESFQGMEAISWISADGETIKEESPLGYTLLKETMTEAKKRDKEGPKVDIINLTMIEAIPIPNPGGVTFLKARLSSLPAGRFELDGDGQRFADGVIEIKTVKPQSAYRLPYRGENFKLYLQPTSLIQSDDPAIQRKAADIIGRERDADAAARLITSWVYESLVKQPVVSIPSAVEVLKQRVGDCNEHTTLFTALARAAGLPTRMAAGIVYMKNGFYYHAWPEVWLGAWIAVDPTLNQFPADATHIRFVSGDLGRQADILKLIGKLKVDILEHR